MAKWKCGICNNEFDNFHAQGFDNIIYCPLCYFKKLNNDKDKKIERLNNIINELEKDMKNNMACYDKLYEEQDEQEYIAKYFALKVELDKLKELKEGK